MIIRQNKLFYILKLVLSWISTVCLFLLFLVVIDVNNASTSDFESKADTTTIKNYEQRMEPFKLNNKEYIVIVKLKKYPGASEGFDETVESFSIC